MFSDCRKTCNLFIFSQKGFVLCVSPIFNCSWTSPKKNYKNKIRREKRKIKRKRFRALRLKNWLKNLTFA